MFIEDFVDVDADAVVVGSCLESDPCRGRARHTVPPVPPVPPPDP